MLMVPVEIQLQIEQVLAHEARLLDSNRLDDWLDLLADDLHYYAPVRELVSRSAARPSGKDAFALFDDDKASIRLRARRMQSNVAPTESPPPIVQRLITNIAVESTNVAGEYRVRSNFLVHLERRGRHSSMLVGSREDILRQSEGGWKIARRQVQLAQTLLPMTISIFL
jgi:3-phenylpropionate/cinnamic acid dioxygenase small subunit